MPEAFARVTVDHIVAGGARISWEIYRHFTDDGPYTFQLQTSKSGLADGDDWENIGAPIIDTYTAQDTEKRVYGKTVDTYYRVKLDTMIDTYYSDPIESTGKLPKRDWLIAREIVRKERLRHRVLSSPNGYLLKARRYGPKCPTCLDALTNEVTQSNCPDCYGTSYEFGYFEPLINIYADIYPSESRTHINPMTATEQKDVTKARFVAIPLLASYDVWVNKYSDERYYLHEIKILSQMRGVDLIFEAELRLAPFSDVIYTYEIDPQTSFSGRRQSEIKLNKENNDKWPIKIVGKDYLDLIKQAKRKPSK